MTTPVNSDQAKRAAHAANAANPSPQGNGFMRYLDQVSNATDYMLTHPISDLAEAISVFSGLVTGNGTAARDAARRMIGWTNSNPIASLKLWVAHQLYALQQQEQKDYHFLIKLIFQTSDSLWKYINQQIKLERTQRIKGDQAGERYTRQQDMALHHLIEREAASAYRGGYRGRTDIIARLADYLANRNPVVRRLTGDLISGLLDLASVDDPLARLALGFVMKHIIERLGVDKVAGAALSDLLEPLLGNPRPHDLPGVIRDVSARLGSLEGQQAQFWTDGGAEVEQAGRQWADVTSPLIDAALIAWLAQAAVDPVAWARELADVTEPVMNEAQKAFTKIVREG